MSSRTLQTKTFELFKENEFYQFFKKINLSLHTRQRQIPDYLMQKSWLKERLDIPVV